MKMRSTFQASVFLMAVLVFSMPVVTLAQQNAEIPVSKATIEPDKLQAIVATAKADAERDVNEVIWFAGSFLGSAVGGLVVVSSCTAYVCLSAQVDVFSSIDGESSSVDASLYLLASGCGLALFSLPIAYAILNTPSPPPERLLGKSPEYVKAYTSVYVRSAKRRRNISITAGYAVFALIGVAIMNQ